MGLNTMNSISIVHVLCFILLAKMVTPITVPHPEPVLSAIAGSIARGAGALGRASLSVIPKSKGLTTFGGNLAGDAAGTVIGASAGNVVGAGAGKLIGGSSAGTLVSILTAGLGR